jgi:serine/threonine-protein kinase
VDPLEGQVIAGKFRLEECIGQGSMGSVWGARHLGLNVPVALKFMSADLVNQPRALARFEREAQAAARIRSPHVVQVLDHGVDGGTPFIVMEWLEGEDLGARLRRVGRLTLQDASIIATQAAKALRAAHDAGVIHRDLKPSNIFLARVQGEEVVKLLDFGVAKVEPATARPTGDGTATGALVGTPEYMSPEQVRGSKEIDGRSDVWSLGVILYVAITGKRPFRGDTLGEVMINVCTAPLPPPSTLVFDLPPVVDWFFDRACARDPANRFQSATDLAAAFGQLAQGRGAPAAGAPGPGAAGARGADPPSGGPIVFIPGSMRTRTVVRNPRTLTPLTIVLLAMIFIMLFVALGQKWIEGVLKDIWDLFSGA